MAMLVSSWSKGVQALPHNYVMPPDRRAGEHIVPATNHNPVVDLTNDRAETVRQILQAGQETGFFQAINHGVSGNLMDEAMSLLREFFDMPGEVKSSVFAVDASKSCRLYTSAFNYDTEEVHFWRDNLTHPVHPVEDCMHLWPQKPAGYGEVIGTYSAEVRKLAFRILDMICEGLGLQQGYFGNELSRVQLLSVNHYPRCPEPSLAMGMRSHTDTNLITILDQGRVHGLQIFKNGQWIGVETIPNAFVILIGCQLQVISNDKFRAAEHRVVTNSKEDRTSLGNFIIPSSDSFIEPAKFLASPPVYRAFQFKDFICTYTAKNGEHEAVMEFYKLED